ncbi:hypothetical protein EDD11_001156 [Mortierella claussenii]|nr:hypothetical protein EDD11_001156 [Mortierella claussenii]
MQSTLAISNSHTLQPAADISSSSRNTPSTASAFGARAGHDAGDRGRTRYRHTAIEHIPQRQDQVLDSQQNNPRSRTRLDDPASPTSSSFSHTSYQPSVPYRPRDQQQQQQQQQSTAAVQPKMPPILPPPGSVPGATGSGFVSGIEAAAASALTLANNIAFRPMTTQPAKCSKLKMRIFFDSTLFQAGGNLFGRMEITATSSRSLKLGEIAVELAAYEGPNIPQSNAVQGPCDENGFWLAKKGKTTFPFAFQLPLDCPSSLVFGQTASLRYVVTGLVQVFYQGRDETILKSKEAFVVEAWDGYNPDYRLPVQASNSTKLFWGGSGSLVIEAMLSERLYNAGGNLSVEVKVKNNTSRKVQGIRLGVARRLEMVSNKDKAEKNPGLKIDTVSVSEVIGTQEFKSSSYLFDTGEERTMTVNMIVPPSARTIRGTALFEVTCFVVVSMLLGTFSGELSVEIPVKICHPASLTPAPKPKLDDNHLPHHYNLVDEDLDLDKDRPNLSSRRFGSEDSLTSPTRNGFDKSGNGGRERELPWNPDATEHADAGRQGEWSQDVHELSPANSITSIKSLLASPKQKLSRLADKIQRSTSPSSSSHLQHEHRQGSKLLDDGRRQIAKSPPLGPAMPIAYVPAVERVRYTPFQPPPTTKAKEFLKAAAQYQQEMSLNGALAGLGDDNVEFDLDDKKMASAIHHWIAKKESEEQYHNATRIPPSIPSSPPIDIPSSSPNRRRPAVGRIDTHLGSFTSLNSQIGSSPRSFDSPTYFGSGEQSPTSPDGDFSFNNQTTSRFLHHAHRQPAAPQTEAFGAAIEDCITDPPLFAKPLPLPSSPQTGSPLRTGGMRPGAPRPLSPAPVPVQTPESLALAREAFERVKRIASPTPDHIMNSAAPGSSAPQSGFVDPPPPRTSLLASNPIMDASILESTLGTSLSGLSRPLGQEQVIDSKHARDGHTVANTNAQPRSSIDLRHVPKRPLPVPGPKPQHLSHGARVPNTSSLGDTEVRSDSELVPISAAAASNGHLRNLLPSVLPTSPARREQPARSGHLPEREFESHLRNGSIQQNAYIPKPTPVPTAKPPPLIHHSIIAAPMTRSSEIGPPGRKKTSVPNGAGIPASGSNSGFIYPKAARKPVPDVKPAVAVKPKVLEGPSIPAAHQRVRSPPRAPISSTPAAMDPHAQAELHQRPRRYQPQAPKSIDVMTSHQDQSLVQPATLRAPQLIAGVQQSSQLTNPAPGLPSTAGEWTLEVMGGFEVRQSISAVPEDVEEVEKVGRVAPSSNAAVRPQEQLYERREQRHGLESRSAEPLNTDSDPSAESEQQTQSEIRAQAIAVKNSVRATGAHTGGYVVNTSKLRQVIKDNSATDSSSNGSGHLVQVLTDGALSAASAAASGLGWRQQSSSSALETAASISMADPAVRSEQQRQAPTTVRTSSPPTQQRIRYDRPHNALSKDKTAALPYGGHRQPTEQPHDLTMKDIHFQTLSPSEQPRPSIFDTLPSSPIKTTDFAGVMRVSDLDYRGTKSQVLVTPAIARAAVDHQQSRSQPGSRVITELPKMEPLPAETVVLAIQAVAAEPATAAAPNLDKTLPKIQEQTPRSRVFERPDRNTEAEFAKVSSGHTNVSSTPVPAPITSLSAKPLPWPKSRYGQGAGETSTPGVAGTGAVPKAINPKLQAYIQKYNLAVNTRS